MNLLLSRRCRNRNWESVDQKKWLVFLSSVVVFFVPARVYSLAQADSGGHVVGCLELWLQDCSSDLRTTESLLAWAREADSRRAERERERERKGGQRGGGSWKWSVKVKRELSYCLIIQRRMFTTSVHAYMRVCVSMATGTPSQSWQERGCVRFNLLTLPLLILLTYLPVDDGKQEREWEMDSSHRLSLMSHVDEVDLFLRACVRACVCVCVLKLTCH